METVHKQIEDALDSIRGYLQADGGDVRLHRITEDLVVELELLGACTSCNMSEMTMKAGIEQAIRRAVPEVQAVRTVNPAA
ncbi:MAG: NifU family protein [Bacteroidetes bacterium]|jgi:Fe-S cluster biogenesis protein NfuA|nr:NifU family protein [Bacteroidota bacterium]